MERQGQIPISSSYRPLDFMHVVQHGTGLICSRVLDLTLRLFVRRHTIVTAIVTVTATATAARGLLLELCDAEDSDQHQRPPAPDPAYPIINTQLIEAQPNVVYTHAAAKLGESVSSGRLAYWLAIM